jgi:hypothetical protein
MKVLPRAALQLLLPLLCSTAIATEYEVGVGKKFSDPNDVPWESLEPGDQVTIFWRAEPYKSKWVICRRGTEEKPIVVRGIGKDGKLPIIDGENAKARTALDYWGDQRSIIKIGGAKKPTDAMPAHIVIENLEIRGAHPSFTATGPKGVVKYASNAASIWIEKGEHITIRGCTLRDSGNGLFVSHQSKDILIEGCSIFGNGNEKSIFEHNVYTEASGITFQSNHFGPLRENARGNNLKDRSAGLVVRYNWIEGGNRQLDLVDAQGSAEIRDDPRYRKTFVYGNVLIERENDGNKQIVHYGGDSGKTAWSRKGTLYFYNNTVISERRDGTLLFRLSSKEEQVDCRNNIVYASAKGRSISLATAIGSVELGNNWFKTGTPLKSKNIQTTGKSILGNSPEFVDERNQNYRLAQRSPCIKGGETVDKIPKGQFPTRQYVKHQSSKVRPTVRDLGAFESEE